MGGKVGSYAPSGMTYVPGQIGSYVNSGFINGRADEFQGVVIPALDHLNIYDPKIPVKPEARFLGFEGEDIMTAEVLCAKVYNEDLLDRTRINEHIRYQHDSLTSLKYATNYSAVGDKQFGLYYRHGLWDYTNHLPDAQIAASSVKTEDIEAIIKQEHGANSIFIDRITLGIPTDKDWIRYILQEQYGYNIAKDILYKDGNYFKLEDFSYDPNTGKFNVQMSSYKVIRPVEYKLVRVVHNIYNGYWCYNETKYKRAGGGEVYDEDSHKLLGTMASDSSGEWELVGTEHVWVYDTNYGQGMGTSYELGGYEPVNNPQVTINLELPGIGTGMYYVVHYRTDIDEVRFWIHKIDGRYPSISDPISVLKDFDMFPMTVIRSGFAFIHDWMGNEELVEETKELLSHVGIDYDELCNNIGQNSSIGDVRDTFFGMGISPSNPAWSVSAALYESLNWIFKLLPPHPDTETKYSVSFAESPFNSTVFFQYRSSTYVDDRYYVDWKDYTLWESEYSHTVRKIGVKIKEYHEVKLARFYASVPDNSDYRLVVGEGRIVYEYEYSDEPGKIYKRYGGIIQPTVCECAWDDDLDDGSDCFKKCKKYSMYAPDKSDSGWWSIDDQPVQRVLWDSWSETTYRLRVVSQIHRYRYHVIDVVDVHQSYIIQDRGETVVKNVYPDDEKFVFPLSVEVEQKLTLMEKTYLLGESCYLFFYAIKWEHLEWYQTGAFQQFMQFLSFVITAVVTVLSMGSMSLASMTTMELLFAGLKAIIIPVALNLALQVIDSLVGDPLLKTILSVAAMAASMIGGWALSGNFTFSSLDLGQAVKMAQLPVKAMDIYNNALFKQESELLARQQSEFTAAYMSQMDQMSAAMEALVGGIDTAFLANLSSGGAEMASVMIQPEDYYSLAFANDVATICDRESFCRMTVDDFIPNSLRLE